MFIIGAVLATQLASVKPPKHRSSAPDSTDMTLVEVQNNRNVPVTVYGQNSWGELKLGVVPAETTVVLRLSDAVTEDGDVDFFVHPKGQADETTGSLEVHRGERLGILVPEKK
jgi:hypothetical protein